MRVLLVHDRYYESTQCGELNVLGRERALLEDRGVRTYLLEFARAPAGAPKTRRMAVQLASAYSLSSARRVRDALAAFAPDVVHIHNFWPQATLAVHYTCRRAGVPVVQTLHNYRILCAADTLLRNRRVCERCIETRLPWPAIRHRCVKLSVPHSTFKSATFGLHRLLDSWNRTVDIFLAPTESMRRRFVRGGIEPRRILVRPQSAPDVGAGPEARAYFLFAGRLAAEKGVPMLLQLWEKGIEAELRIAGGGPLEGLLREHAARCARIRYLGAIAPSAVGEAMRHATATLVPSLWEEPFPLVIAESYAAGTPVIAADVGSRAETVIHGETGLVFAAGDIAAFETAVRRAIDDPAEMRRLGHGARRRYESLYSEDASVAQLLDIYRACLRRGAAPENPTT